MINIPCHCGKNIETDFSSEIDLSASKQVYRDILEGSFMSFECPSCGNVIRTELKTVLKDPESGLNLLFLPELERINFITGKIDSEADSVAIGYPELVEKILIAGEGLDERAIEIIKFRLLLKAPSTGINIVFKSIENNNLIFHVLGLKENETGITKIPRSAHDDILQNIASLSEDEDVRMIIEGPYISVSKISLED